MRSDIKKTIRASLYGFLKIYWSVFRVPVVINLLFNENYTRLDWDKYFLFNYRNIIRGYLNISRQALLSDAVKRDDEEKQLQEVALSNYDVFFYRGINLWEVCKASVLSDLNSPDLVINDHQSLEIVKNYYRMAIKYMDAAKALFNKHNVSAVLYSQGATFSSRSILEVAQRHGVTTVAIENSFCCDHFYADNSSGMILNRHALQMPIWSRASARELTSIQREKLFKVTEELYGKKNPEHINEKSTNMEDLRRQYKLANQRKIAVLIGQVMSDASVIMDSSVFPNPVEFIKRTINYFEKLENEWYLIVRLHPYESHGITNSSLTGDYKSLNNPTHKALLQQGFDSGLNYCILEGTKYDTESILRNSDMGITINSQAGLEMLLFGKPVVVAGRATYASKGFTYDVPCQQLYEDVLGNALANPVLTDMQKNDVYKFAYTLLFEYSFPRDITKLGSRFENLFRRGQGYVDLIEQIDSGHKH